MKQVLVLILMAFFIVPALADEGVCFSTVSMSGNDAGDTFEITGILHNRSGKDLSGTTMTARVENAEPLITAFGNERILIRRRSDKHAVADFQNEDTVPVTVQWKITENGNGDKMVLSFLDSNTEVARCTIPLKGDVNTETPDAAKIRKIIIALTVITGFAAAFCWMLVIVRIKRNH